VKWQQDAEDPAAIQGYKLFYKEEGQQEHGPIFLDTNDLLHTLSGLGERVGTGLFFFIVPLLPVRKKLGLRQENWLDAAKKTWFYYVTMYVVHLKRAGVR
jgi:hypothetical protein